MIFYILSKIISMCMGLLYPAYCSYKAVKEKNVKEYVHWMMYWIVFSLYSFFEVFVDTLIGCWFPFYYELKIMFILWMLSPTTRGGSFLYRRIIHPMFTRYESEIDAYLADFKYHASNLVVRWGTSAFNYVTDMIMTSILRAGSDYAFLQQKKGSFSVEGYDERDLNRNTHIQRTESEATMFSDTEQAPSPDVGEQRHQRRTTPNDRNSSTEREMNRYNERGLPKPYSMMNLGAAEGDVPPKVRSSSRKKKEFGNYTVVSSQDMTMPLVFGWYPPPNVAPDTASLYIQPSMLPSLMSPQSLNNPVEVASSDQMETFYSSDDTQDNYESEEDDDVMELESETDNFFDCDMETNEEDDDEQTYTEKSGEDIAKSSSSSSIQPPVRVRHVSKTNLQTFEADQKDVKPPARGRSSRSNDRDLKRNSMSSLQSKSGLAGASDKSKVRKSLSNSDLKLVKPTSIWSSSSFRRVLSPFSSSPTKSSSATNLKRSGSNASRASLNLEKKRKSESNSVERN